MRKLLWSVILFSLPMLAFADATAPTDEITTTHPPMHQYTLYGTTITAYADGSYNYLSREHTFTSGVNDRLYDLTQNGLTLQQAVLSISRQPTDGWGFLFNPLIGRDAHTTAAFGMNPLFNQNDVAIDLVQAYLQYGIHKVTVIAGKFSSLAGYEAIFSIQNANFSHTYINQFAEPGTVTGIRATYAATDKLNLIMGINDGWDNIRDWSRRKTIELSAAYTDPKYSLSGEIYNGQERATPFTAVGPEGIRTLFDIYGSYNITDKLTLAGCADYATQSNAFQGNGNLAGVDWYGVSAYVLYQFNDRWRAALRGDAFNDPNGFASGVDQNLRDITLTVGYQMFKHFELRAEGRGDISNKNSFQNNSNGSSTSHTMQSLAIEGLLSL